MTSNELPYDVVNKVDLFEPQYTTNDCLPTCIRNIMRKFTNRKIGKRNPFNLSKSDINKSTDYDNLGASKADMKRIKKRLDKDLKGDEIRCIFQYTDQSRNVNLNLNFLFTLINDENKSLPIVSFSIEYFDDPNFPWDVSKYNRFPHSVISLEINNEKVYIWDGLISYKADNDIKDGIIILPKERFIRYWDNYYYSKEVCWLELETRKEVDSY